jgi:cytochrome P450
MEAIGALRIEDLPILEQVESPDFGTSMDWIAELFQRPYEGMYRASWNAPVFFRNGELREVAAMKEATHQTIEAMSGYWVETAPDHCQGLVDTFAQTSFSMRHPYHLPTKKITSRRFTSASVARFAEAARTAVRTRINEVGDGSQIDFMEEFAKPAVAHFWSLAIGLTKEESSRAIELITDFQLSSLMAPSAEQIGTASASSAEYVALMTAAVNREIAGGQYPVLNELAADFEVRDEMVQADNPGTALGVMMLDAFHTFSALSANVIHAMISAPTEHERVRADRSLVEEAFQEGSRLHPAPMLSHREALHDFEYKGVFIPEGTPLLMMWGVANRDPAVWDDPATYRLGRGDRSKQTTFGGGAYACSGKNVARLMGETFIRELTEPNVRVEPAGDAEWVPGSSIHELHAMPTTVRHS